MYGREDYNKPFLCLTCCKRKFDGFGVREGVNKCHYVLLNKVTSCNSYKDRFEGGLKNFEML